MPSTSLIKQLKFCAKLFNLWLFIVWDKIFFSYCSLFALFCNYRGKQNKRSMLQSTFLKIIDSWAAEQIRREVVCPFVISFHRLQTSRSHLHFTKERSSNYKPKIQKFIAAFETEFSRICGHLFPACMCGWWIFYFSFA